MDMPTPPAGKRGGRRDGAGRPRLHEAGVERVVVYLPPSYVGALVRVGGGNISQAIRQLIEDAGIVL